jgi:hypothetical protein
MKKWKIWVFICLILSACGNNRDTQIEKCVQAGINLLTEEAKEAEKRNIAEFGLNWRTSPNLKTPQKNEPNQIPTEPRNTEAGATSVGKRTGSGLFSYLDEVKTSEHVMSSSEIEFTVRLECLKAAAGR